MKNQPMSSSDQSKLLIFSLLMVPSLVFLFGIIPAIFLGFGIYMMKKNKDFSSIETAVKNFKVYTFLAIIICAVCSIYWGAIFFSEGYDNFSGGSYNNLKASLVFSAISFAYLIVVQVLFYSPMNRHREWVEVNGIFSTRPNQYNTLTNLSEVDIIKGEKFKQYSVADELTKWAKLKEDGYISEEEFNQARTKLLKRN